MSSTNEPVRLMAANRGEIAIRIFRAATELGLRTVGIFAEEDRYSRHRFKADEAYQLDKSKGPVGAYLDIEGIIEIAKSKNVKYIHPGYGFLSENPDFARACGEAGITFIGPDAELLDNMGDKTAARQAAHKFGVPTLPGTEEAIVEEGEAQKIAKEIGFPLIIKAAFGGGGRGMRVVMDESELEPKLREARQEAERAFGNPAVFLERYISRAKHIEVQILGDRHGDIVHLHERDCSVQRRYQKVVEIAPSVDLPGQLREELCQAAVDLAKGIGYNNAGTVEFLYDMDKKDWFFIEMNPRVQVEHTVTECVTGVDIVRSQILIAQGKPLHGEDIAIPAQKDIPCNGYAIQCRITTEDPEKGFAPDYGRIINYRSAAGFGIRLDAGSGDAGSVITPYYDSMLVKVTAMGSRFDIACQRMDRALQEFRIRGVKTNIPFLENVIEDSAFQSGKAHTKLIDSKPELLEYVPRRDRATKLINYLSEVTINGNPTTKNWRPEAILPAARIPEHSNPFPSDQAQTKLLLNELGPEGFCQWVLKQDRLLFTDTTMRDAHQSLMATRMRSFDMFEIAEVYAHRAPHLFSLEMWGGATFDTAMRFLKEDPWERLRKLRKLVPNILFQMLFRGSNAVGYSNYPDKVVAGFVKHAADSGMDVFRIFDSLNYLPNMQVAMEAVREHGKALCEGVVCYTGNITDPKRDKYSLKYYIEKAKELEKMGAHLLCIKDMAGLCRPFAARKLFKALKEETNLPIHFHTHDTSGISAASVLAAAEAGVDIVDSAIASMSGSTSQPNLNSLVAALEGHDRDSELNLEALDDISDYFEEVLHFYQPFNTAPRAGTAEVYEHEMPGGQFTNLKEQANAMGLGHRWREISRTYAEVNLLFGDIIKVTPSSKVVGDMAMFLVTRGMKAADVLKLEPGSVDWPESVIDMLAGGLGQPDGGWPSELQKVILADKPVTTKRPGELAAPVDFGQEKKTLTTLLGRLPTQDDLYSHLMYPKVYEDYIKNRKKYGNLSVLPTSSFFYGLQIGEEIHVNIAPGKIIYIKLLSIGEADHEGNRTLFYELNGMPRESVVHDLSVGTDTPTRQKGDPDNPNHLCSPMPGVISEIPVKVGDEVKAGDKVLILEAMKMLTTVSAAKDGTIKALYADKGAQVDSDDLLAEISD